MLSLYPTACRHHSNHLQPCIFTKEASLVDYFLRLPIIDTDYFGINNQPAYNRSDIRNNAESRKRLFQHLPLFHIYIMALKRINKELTDLGRYVIENIFSLIS